MTDLRQLGHRVPLPASPDEAVIETVPNPHPGKLYAVRFTCPEFTALCPITAQPDFAHLVIDYVPEAALIESKSLKLFLGAFRNHGAFHEDCTVTIAARLVAAAAPRWLRIGGYWYPRGGIPIDVFYQTGAPPDGLFLPDASVGALSRPGVMEPTAIREAIRAEALALGFDAVGFAEARLVDAARADLAEFLRRGYHGDMDWLAAKEDRRGDPQTLWPEARTVVVLGLNYGGPEQGATADDRGVVSAYARGRDYHDTIKRRLKRLGRWIAERWPLELKVFVDTAPVMEKPLAQQAGLGWQGKHTNLVSRQFGSWLFLGEIYLSLALDPDPAESDHCGTCRACLDACPTAAFPAPYRLDARRCISYLTIEHKGAVPRELRHLIGNRIFGCDDCLAACPWNKYAHMATEPDFLPREALTAPRLAELAALDDAGFRSLFAGTSVKRVGRDRFVRNVLIAIGNGSPGDPELVAAAEARLGDASGLVRATAAWAYTRHAPSADIWHRVRHDPDPLMQAECAEMVEAT